MDKKTALNILSDFHLALLKYQIPVRDMILFGSYSTGRQEEGSDIDVVVVSERFRGLDHWQRIQLVTDALYEVFKPIEARFLTPEEWDSKQSATYEYAKDGERLAFASGRA